MVPRFAVLAEADASALAKTARRCVQIPLGHGACPPRPLGGRNVGQWRCSSTLAPCRSLITVPGTGLPYVALAANQPQRVVLHRVFDPQQGERPANPAHIGLAGVNSLCRCAKSDKLVVRQLFPASQTTAHITVGGRCQCPAGRVAVQMCSFLMWPICRHSRPFRERRRCDENKFTLRNFCHALARSPANRLSAW